jgi:hypothetical protein
MRSPKVLPFVLCLGSLAVVVAAGFYGAPPRIRFDWGVAATVGTALGTLTLALFTALLAASTRADIAASEKNAAAAAESAAATRELAELGRQQMLLERDPHVAITDARFGKRPAEDLWATPHRITRLEFTNMGRGPARNIQFHVLTNGPGEDRQSAWDGVIGALPSGASRVEESPIPWRDGMNYFRVVGTYFDADLARKFEINPVGPHKPLDATSDGAEADNGTWEAR